MSRIGSYLKKTSLTFRIVSGLVLGILSGLFFGEKAASLQIIADIWIGLMQMTVLPYVMVSLIAGLGQLDLKLAKLLAVKGGLLMLLFWGIALVVITAMPFAFPEYVSASFFSAHSKEVVTTFNPIDLYIPSNPFRSMTNTVIPAVVIFSVAVGVALIGMPNKSTLIQSLDTFLEALGRVTRFVVALTPIGVFAIVAVAAGTMTWEEITRLEAYFVNDQQRDLRVLLPLEAPGRDVRVSPAGLLEHRIGADPFGVVAVGVTGGERKDPLTKEVQVRVHDFSGLSAVFQMPGQSFG